MPSFVADKVFLTGAPGTTLPAFGLGNVAAQVIPWLAAPSRPVYNILAYNNISPSQPGLNLGQVGRKFENVHARSIYPDKLGSLSNTIDITVMESQTPFRETVAWRFVPRSNVMDFKSMGGSLDARHVSCSSLDVGGVSVQDMLAGARAYTDDALNGIVSTDVDLTRNIVPAAHNAYDLGSYTRRFANVHAGKLHAETVYVDPARSIDIRSHSYATGFGPISWSFKPRPLNSVIDLESRGGNLVMGGGNIQCSNLAVSGSLHMGPSATNHSANNRIANLAYGLDDLDACPKKQIEEMGAITLSAAKAYADEKVLEFGGTEDVNRNLVPSYYGVLDIGSAERRFREIHALIVLAGHVATEGDVNAGGALRGKEIHFLNNKAFSESNVGPFCSPIADVQQDVVAHLGVSPAEDNLHNLGQARLRYKNVFAGSVKTSSVRSATNTPIDVGTFDPVTASETVSWRFQPRADQPSVHDLVSVSGTLVMGESTTNQISNNRIANLAYGLNDLDACPKKQVEEISAETLAAARSYADQRVAGMTRDVVDLTRTASVLPAAGDAYDLGSAERRFRECHAQSASIGDLRVSGTLHMGASGTDQSLNGRVANLAYATGELDACPKRQVEEMCAGTLTTARAHADAALAGDIRPNDVYCRDIRAGGKIVMSSGDLFMEGNQIKQLDRGSDDYDACPKLQVEDICAQTLTDAKAYTDAGLAGDIAPRDNGLRALGTDARRYTNCFVEDVNLGGAFPSLYTELVSLRARLERLNG